MPIVAIDPGDLESAWMLYDAEDPACPIRAFGKEDNLLVLRNIQDNLWGGCGVMDRRKDCLVIEMVACYGMPVGATVFNTCVWIGRFLQAWGGPWALVYRMQVKMHLCKSSRAKDPNIRQALLDRFGPPGTKKNPGHTYGISGDVWAALGVAVTYTETVAALEVPGQSKEPVHA